MLFESLKPRESRFFELFQESTTLIGQAAQEFLKMVDDLAHVETHAKNIKEIEHKADEVTHRTIELLHKVFITPMDRDDIHKLVTRLDDICDFIEAASQRLFLFGVTKVTPEAKQLAQVCLQAAESVQRAVSYLQNLKDRDRIMKECVEINRLENEADQILRSAVATLFREESDIKQLIKLKEIYELLETVTDRCEDVANVIESIVLEYA